MNPDNFDDWFAKQLHIRLEITNLGLKEASARKADLRAAWEAGWEAGKLYGEFSENERQDNLRSIE